MNRLGKVAILACMGAAVCSAAAPTFNREVVRIFQQNCQSCHHPGDIAPFSLMDYASAKPYSPTIKTKVMGRIMPVWKPVPGVGDFAHPRILSDANIQTIVQWVDAGSPEGNPADLPPPLTFPDGWVLGKPDIELSMAPFSVPAGPDLYRCFSLDPGLTQQRDIAAAEVRAGNHSIVHHVILFPDSAGASKKLDDQDPAPGYTCFGGPGFNVVDDSFFGGWAPGVRPAFLNPGTAFRLAAGSRIVLQVHYHPRGDDLNDQTRIGLYFAPGPVDKLVHVLPMVNTSFTIPAGNPHYEVKGTLPFNVPVPFDAHLVSIAPHMHLLGKEISAQATLANNTNVGLIRIADWDFDWQAVYDYRVPVAIPSGTRLSFSAFYDNSANNPKNPNSPPKNVGWGEQTTDEMAVVFFGYTLDSEHQAAPQMGAGSLVNAASFAGGASAPGAMVSLFGMAFGSNWEAAGNLPLPKSLAKIKVNVGGVDAPLVYASPTQVNLQVPFEVSGTVSLTLTRGDDGKTQSLQLPLGEAQPGIFTFTSDGVGPAAALRRNGSAVGAGNPAARGEIISLYAAGLGRVTPSVASGAAPVGLATTVNSVVVTIGNKQVTADFAGLAPGFAGLYQVNFLIPADVTPGPETPLKLTVAGISSNTTKLAIE